jgi:hypothetical protein
MANSNRSPALLGQKLNSLKFTAVWSQYKAKYNKTYSNATEENYRKELLAKT